MPLFSVFFPTKIIVISLFLIALHHFSYGQWRNLDVDVKCNMRAVQALSPSICWIGASEGSILKTLDGGKSWTIYKVPNADSLDFRDIHVFDEFNVLAMSAGLSQEGKAKIYRTSDGGLQWNVVYNTSQNEVFLNGLAFWDGKFGICQGDPIDGNYFVLTTTDSGKTWKELPKENRPIALENEVCFAASGTSLITTSKGIAYIGTGGAAFARIIKTTDYGITWEYGVTPMKAGPTSGIFGINFWSKKDGMAVGGDYNQTTKDGQNILLTSNGGKTWKLQTVTKPAGLKESVGMYHKTYKTWDNDSPIGADNHALVAVGPSGTSYTLNYGKTWNFLGTDGFHAVSFAGNTGYAVGANGKIAIIKNIPSHPMQSK